MGRHKERVAYIFGNDSYPNGKALFGARNDAALMEETLGACGFQTMKFTDLTLADFSGKIEEFKKRCEETDVCLFYYAGHGFEYKGDNYLCPIDARNDDIEATNINISNLVDGVSKDRNFVCIVILDCCRNIMNRERGIDVYKPMTADFKNRGGTFVAYATSSGQGAMEKGGHGLYTGLLCKHISGSRKPIEQIFKNVRKELLQEGGVRQISWEYSSLVEDFYFLQQEERQDMGDLVKEVWEMGYSYTQMVDRVERYCEQRHIQDRDGIIFAVLNEVDKMG